MRALLLLLVLAGTATAKETGDACSAGDSELGDERAIATVRAKVEEACPCATFTGKRGHDRAAYQRCARGVLTAALGDGTLRAECKAVVRSVNRGSLCGSPHAVACGRVGSHRGQVIPSCRVQPAARCKDGGGTNASVCTDATACADVVEWTAGTCLDPLQPGPYAVGFTILPLVKKSVVDPTADRALDTVVWYPARPGGTVAVVYGGVRDAPLDRTAAPYPLLLFSHGSCGFPAQSTFLTALLASWGFVVAAPPHPGNTLSEITTCGTPAAQIASAQERPADVRFVLDQMLAPGAGSPFAGAVDANRVGMSGHSFGGLTTLVVVPMEPRFKVAMPLAPAVLGEHILTVPSLTMLGEIDGVVDDDAIRTAYASASPPKLLVSVQDAGHFAFSNGCFPSPDCMPPVTRTQDEAHQEVLRYAVPFLQVYLAGDDRFRPLLDVPAVPGVTVEAMR